jgi:arabinose-5-phosphate isomerase
MPATSFFTSAQRTIELETQAVADLANQVDAEFEKACQILLQCKGRVVVTGMGKSGHIGN